MSAITVFNFTVHQGAKYTLQFNAQAQSLDPLVAPIAYDLDGKGVRGAIRPTYDSEVEFEFDHEITDEANGQILLSLSALITGEMQPGTYVYDIEIYDLVDTGDVDRALMGTITVSPEATK